MLLTIDWTTLIEPLGTLASFIILVSLIMRSVKRLRIINLIGSIVFIAYAIFIQSIPVLIMNVGIVWINIYYLYQMYKSEDYFKVLAIDKHDEYLKAFLSFYKKDIKQAMAFKEDDLNASDYRFFVLRNMVPAGVFIANEYDEDTLEITLDYATPAYQDFKTSKHVFDNTKETFISQGYKHFITFTEDEKHIKYLERMDFEPTIIRNKKAYTKNI